MCKWIPVKHSETCGTDVIVSELPKDGEAVFVTVNGTKVWCDIFGLSPNGRENFKHFDIEKVEAWMNFPTPYVPRTCGNCRYGMRVYDNDGFRWTDCQLLGDGVFSNTKPVDCPLKKEVDHGSN